MYYIKVSNLPNNTPECDLKAFFAENGFPDISVKTQDEFINGKAETVEYVRVNADNEQDEKRENQRAIDTMNNKTFKGQQITVEHDYQYRDDRIHQPSKETRRQDDSQRTSQIPSSKR
ncbi:MAG: hypothetical protein AAFO06_12140 [Cyanobacteria bacterium J06597_16]